MKWDSMTRPPDQIGIGIMDLGKMGVVLAVKWIFRYANERHTLWSRVVCAKSKIDPGGVMPR